MVSEFEIEMGQLERRMFEAHLKPLVVSPAARVATAPGQMNLGCGESIVDHVPVVNRKLDSGCVGY